MPAIPYLTGSGSETLTAARMNTLFQELDRRLAKILGGKSFILNFPNTTDEGNLIRLMGKPFFFVSGNLTYCKGVRGFAANGAHGGYAYSQTPFTDALAAATVTSWDETNKIAHITAVNASYYTAAHVTAQERVGFFDHSLKTGYILHQGASDAAPVPYYVLENYGGLELPEKHYDYALAELILEGQTEVSFTFSDSELKFKAYRVHNLNQTAATVTITMSDTSDVLTVTVPAFGCVSFRLYEETTAGVRHWLVGKAWVASPAAADDYCRYFQPFRTGDPRFYWWLPSALYVDIQTYRIVGTGNQYPSVANAMAANNVSCPAIVFDYFAVFSQTSLNAYWVENVHEVTSVNRDGFGDISNPATLIGDLIHHRGDILLIRTSRTQTLSAPGNPRVPLSFELVRFNGYATIVADFAAHGLTVAVNGAGNLQISNAQTASNCALLIPISTNLLKQGEYHPGDKTFGVGANRLPIDLNVSIGGDNPYVIENSLFPSGSEPFSYTKQLTGSTVLQRVLQETANTRTWRETTYNCPEGSATNTDHTVTATPIQTLAEASGAHASASFRTTTVGDVLSLVFWGDGSLSNQSNAYVTFSGITLTMTPMGLVLTFTESIVANIPPANGYTDYTAPADGFGPFTFNGTSWTRKRRITLHGHGFGFPFNGLQGSLYVPQRLPVKVTRAALTGEATGKAGADLDGFARKCRATDFQILKRINLTGYDFSGGVDGLAAPLRAHGARSFKIQTAYNAFNLLATWKTYVTLAELDGHTVAGTSVINGLYSGNADSHFEQAPIVFEHYNAMARAVNSLTEGKVLDYTALRFYVPASATFESISSNASALYFPVPMDLFSSAGMDLYRSIGIPVKTEADFPAEFAAAKASFNRWGKYRVSASVALSNILNTDAGWVSDVTVTIQPVSLLETRDDTSPGRAGWHPNLPSVDAPATPQNHLAEVNLASGYAGFEWVSITDVKAFLAGFDFPFVFNELCHPFALEIVDLQTEPSAGLFNHLSETVYGHQSDPAQEPPRAQESPSVLEFYRQIKMIFFRPAETTAEAKWKSPFAAAEVKRASSMDVATLDYFVFGAGFTKTGIHVLPGFPLIFNIFLPVLGGLTRCLEHSAGDILPSNSITYTSSQFDYVANAQAFPNREVLTMALNCHQIGSETAVATVDLLPKAGGVWRTKKDDWVKRLNPEYEAMSSDSANDANFPPHYRYLSGIAPLPNGTLEAVNFPASGAATIPAVSGSVVIIAAGEDQHLDVLLKGTGRISLT